MIRPVLAIICGFEPDDTPGVGTFYEFIDRQWLMSGRSKPHLKSVAPKPRQKDKRNEKMESPKHPGSVEHLVNRIAKYQDSPAPSAPYEVDYEPF